MDTTEISTPAPGSGEPTPFEYERVAGVAMQIAGSLLVFLGVAFYLKLAFNQWGDSIWLGPPARVLAGLIAGAALIVAGSRRSRGNLELVGDGLIALGGGLMYLALWASSAMFHLAPSAAVLAGMLAVTTAIVGLAWKRSSERLALGALVGGYLSPALLGFGAVHRIELAAYLLVIGAGLLWLSNVARFRLTEVLAFVALLFYAPYFIIDRFSTPAWTAADSAIVATLFFIEYAGALYLQARNAETVSPGKLVLIVTQTVIYMMALGVDFIDQRRTLAIALLALAAVLAFAVRSRSIPRAVRETYGWLGLAAATLAVPAYFTNGHLVLDAFSIEGALLVIVGMRTQYRPARVVGYGLLALAGAKLAAGTSVDPDLIARPFFNDDFASLAIFATALGSIAYGLRDFRESTHEVERALLRCSGTVANAVMLTGIEIQTNAAFVGTAWEQGMLSVVAAAYATLAILAGIARRDPELKAFALLVLGLTVGKVFAIDLAFLGSLHRTITFVSIGTMLVGASIVYQRSLVKRGAVD
jgi:uncharacterized membrane protein